jgi:hypothetical protein
VALLGRALEAAAHRSLLTAKPIEGELRRARTKGQLLPRPAPEVAASPPSSVRPAAVTPAPSDSAAERRRLASTEEGAALAAGLSATATATEIEIDGVAIGDLALVAIPGELLADLGREIVDRSPFATTLVFGYTNGYLGYIADSAAHAAATYEALASPFGPNAGDTVVHLVERLLANLAGPRERGDTSDVMPGS